MTPRNRLDIASEIGALNAAFWHEVDRKEGVNAPAFFTGDGLFTTSLRRIVGRTELIAYYQWRRTRETTRTTRHLITNHHVEVQDEDHATGDWVLVLYAADGEPVLPVQPPVMIADVHDVCVRGSDARWRYASRTMTAIFKSDGPIPGQGPAFVADPASPIPQR